MDKIKQKIYNWLKWSEKYTKTDMIYLAKGGSWLTLGQIVSSISAFLLAIAFANLLPKEIYGNYKYILSIAGILAIPTLGGMNTAITQAVARGYEGSFITALKTKIRWGLLGAVASLILAGYYYINENTLLTISFLIVAVFTPFFDSFNLYNALLNGKKLFNISTKYNIVSQILSVLFLIITIFLTKNIFIILLAYFIPLTLIRYFFLKITLNRLPKKTKEDTKTISYGKHLSLMSILGTISIHIDKILIFHYLGAAQLAIYAFAIAIPEQIKGSLKIIGVLAVPKFSAQNIKNIKLTIYPKILKLSIFITFILIAYMLTAPYIYKMLFPQYLDSVFYSQLFSISLITAAAILPISILNSQKATKHLYILNTIAPIIKIILLIVLTPFYGIIGIIFARIIDRFIVLAISLILLKHKS